MSEQLKILICGDVESNFSKLFTKVKNVNKKSGPFDYLFCIGNFFESSDEELSPYKSGREKVPVPTYVLGPNSSKSSHFYSQLNEGEFAPNITYLGKRGVFTTSTGLSVAYVSGVEDSNISSECRITMEDVERVRSACIKSQDASYRGIDILLTSTWPEHVTNLDNNAVSDPPKGSFLISKLVVEIKPRYHFFGMGKKYYERRPYKNEPTSFGCHFTRAIALANVGNEDKQKWIFAMNLTPIMRLKGAELYQLTTDTTECPYNIVKERPSQQFFYDMSYKDESRKNKKRKNQEFQEQIRKVMNVSQDDCWFCLASPKFEENFVVSVGDEAYLTIAKGGLVWDHVMILPITHYRTFHGLPPAACEEIVKFKKSLVEYYAISEKIPVFFDRNYKTPHYQIQVIPIPSTKLETASQLFVELAEEKGFSLTEIPENAELTDILASESSYFYLEIGNKRYFHTIKKYFPLQFGREVLAQPSILNVMDRIEWRNIESSKEKDTEIVEKFREKYKPFDFTA